MMLNQRKLWNEMNVKVNFYGKAKLTKTRNVYNENNKEDYVVIEKTKTKVLKNSWKTTLIILLNLEMKS